MQCALPRQRLRQFAQLAALDLLRRGERQRVDEGDVARRLVVGQLRQRMLDDARPRPAQRCDASTSSRMTMQASTSSPRTASGVAATAEVFTRRMLVEHALDLDGRDVLAAAADHVLLAVDEEEVALRVAPHHVAGVEPAAGPGFARGRLVLQVAGEEVAPRVVARGAHQQFARRVDRRRRGLRRRRAGSRRSPRWRPKQLVPTRRGSRLAITQAAAPVSVMAQASTSGKPKRASKGAWFLRSTPAPKPQRIAWSRSAADARRRQQHRRHHAEVVRRWWRRFRARSRSQRLRMEAVELHQAAAGDQHHHGRERHRVHVVERQRRDDALGVGADAADAVERGIPLAGAQEVGVAQHAALGPAGGARGVEQRAFGVAGRSAPPARGAAVCARRHRVVGPHRLEGDAGLRRGGAQVGRALRAASRPGRSRCGRSGRLSSAERISALIGTTLTPSALSANQWKRKAGRFSSSRPTRWPWP